MRGCIDVVFESNGCCHFSTKVFNGKGKVTSRAGAPGSNYAVPGRKIGLPCLRTGPPDTRNSGLGIPFGFSDFKESRAASAGSILVVLLTFEFWAG